MATWRSGVLAVVLLLQGAQAFQPSLHCTKAGCSGRIPPTMMARGDGEGLERRSVVLTGASAMVSALVAGGLPLLARPERAAAKYTNIDEAREAGEKKRDEIEEQKGPLTILQGGVRYEAGHQKGVKTSAILRRPRSQYVNAAPGDWRPRLSCALCLGLLQVP